MVEVMAVVIGVFIGPQVGNWNDDRKEAARGDEYLRRRDAELRQDAATLRAIALFWKQVNANGVVTVEYAEAGALAQDIQPGLSCQAAGRSWLGRRACSRGRASKSYYPDTSASTPGALRPFHCT